ncbi:MAG: YhdP family protein, partial [Betaproteobacteria bacterium]
DRLDVGPLAGIADALPLDAGVRSRIVQSAPRGRVEDLRLGWNAESLQAGLIDLDARFVGVGVAPVDAMPGISGLTGRVHADRNGGRLDVDSRGLAISVPRQFDQPLRFDSLKGQAAWSLPDGHALVRLQRLAFANADLSGTASGSYQLTEQGPGIIDLAVLVSRADARAVPRYVPFVAGAATRKWLGSAFEAGVARDATFRLKGNLSDFPFDKPGVPGVFDVSALVEGVRLRFDKDWPTVDAVHGTLTVHGRRLEVSAEGSILGIPLDRTTAVIPELSPHHPVIEIKGGASGPTQDFLAFIDASPVAQMIGGFSRGMRARGSGHLALDLRIPLDHDNSPAIAGSYQFVDNQLDASESVPALTDLNATLNFTQAGANISNGTAKLFDLPAKFSVAAESGGSSTISASGRASLVGLQRAFDTPWLAYAEGETDWKARATVRNRVLDLVVESDLVGVTSKLPAPLAKAAGEALPLRVQRRSRGKNQTLQVALGQRLSAALALETVGAVTRIKRGVVDFGAGAKLPQGAGVSVTGSFDRIDVDAWLDVFEAAAGQGGGSATATDAIDLTAVDLKVNQVEVFGRVLHDVALNIRHKGDLWDGALSSREVAGDVDWIPTGRGKVVARLSRLNVPDPEGGGDSAGAEPLAGHELPAIDVTADSFQFGALDLGGLVLKATQSGPAWQLETLALTNPDFSLSAHGTWQLVRGTPRTELQVKLDVKNLAGFQKRIQRPEGVVGGPATLEGTVDWIGVPYRPDYATLSGTLKLDVHQGRFLKLDPGIGKLLGVMSLQSLPRRVKLDFRDVFSEGFAFQRITGTVSIDRGMIHTNDMKMQGSSAKVTMKGDVNMVDETQSLEVRVAPSISDSIALGTALVNPAIGLATFLVGKALKDPLDQVIAFVYRITGGWADPVVTKVHRQSESAPLNRR